VSEDELLQRFELARESIGRWAGETAGYVRAAAETEMTGTSHADTADAAERSLAAVRAEKQALAEARRDVDAPSDDLANGIVTALTELGNLEQTIGDALGRLRRPHPAG